MFFIDHRQLCLRPSQAAATDASHVPWYAKIVKRRFAFAADKLGRVFHQINECPSLVMAADRIGHR
jgi:hypothetical protein